VKKVHQNVLQDRLHHNGEGVRMRSENYGIIIEAIDEGLSIMGVKSKEIVYFFVEKEYGLKREDIPNNLQKFHESLYKIFGFGGFVIEKGIMSFLEKKLDVVFPKAGDKDFVKYVGELGMIKGEV